MRPLPLVPPETDPHGGSSDKMWSQSEESSKLVFCAKTIDNNMKK